MARIFRARRKAGKVPFDARHVSKEINKRVTEIFILAIHRWLFTFSINVPVWSGEARSSLLFAKGNFSGQLSDVVGVKVPIDATPPNKGTVKQSAISRGASLGHAVINKPHLNTVKPEKFKYEFSFSTTVDQILMSSKWPLGPRDSVSASGPLEARKFAEEVFRATMSPRIVKRAFIDELRKQGFKVK